jgi:tRNA(Ile2)-agmatinylcytidine synthase
VLTELLRVARDARVDLIGEPRLVRLNPNIPWKTRGNAALAARFGRGSGRRRRIGEVDGAPVWSHPRGTALSAAVARTWIDRAWSRVVASARTDSPGTDPALVAVSRPLPAALYWEAVREVVEPVHVRGALERAGADVRTVGSDRGIVGAAAAIAWPGSRPTWELISYRAPERVGSQRDVDAESVRAAQAAHPELFLCFDPRTRRLLVAPHTDCPILFGLRATEPAAALVARRTVRSEPVDRWVLFRTNQGSGDHLVPRSAGSWPELRSGVMLGTVAGTPMTLAGGHVRFPLVDAEGTAAACLAFEPTKTLPSVARSLRTGDRVRVWASRGPDLALHLEGLELVRLAPRPGRSRSPLCGRCGRAAHSMGRQRGYRCDRCHARWPPEAVRVGAEPPKFGVGRYYPTASARRHLAPRAPET